MWEAEASGVREQYSKRAVLLNDFQGEEPWNCSVSGCGPTVDSSISSGCLARDLSEAIAENEVTSSLAAVRREPQVDKTLSVCYRRCVALWTPEGMKARASRGKRFHDN